MTESVTKRASLADLRKMRITGKLHHDPAAVEGAELGDEFWENAVLTEPKIPTSVHLKLDPEVFAFFKRGGKGHLTRMQKVLEAYVAAQKRKAG